jgi:hypothetical protein
VTFDTLVQFIKDVGFPAGVAFFVLWRLDKTLVSVRDEIRQLRYDLGGRDKRDEKRRDY